MKIIKNILTAILAAVLVSALSANVFGAAADFGNFTNSGAYSPGQFRDVEESDWFARYVEDACNYGFFQGKSEREFDPQGDLTLGEAVTLAARLRSIYHTGSADFTEGAPFYAVYRDYAISHGMIDPNIEYDYSAPAVRAQFAELLYRALPPEALAQINTIADNGVNDVVSSDAFGDAVYSLYRAGVITGSDRFGTFFPYTNISRAEASAIMVRLAVPAARQRVSLPTQIPAEIIYQRGIDAVFMLETFDEDGESIRTGSGFFISSDGFAVTLLHVLDYAAGATATLSGGEVYDVNGVYAIDRENNLALLFIDTEGGAHSFLNLADSDAIETGNTVYTLGNPQSLFGTLTEGLISTTSRELGGQDMIQFSAPISFGSGGSPLLNALGQVIGIASSSYSYGQNLNLAVPINPVRELQPGEYVTLISLYSNGT